MVRSDSGSLRPSSDARASRPGPPGGSAVHPLVCRPSGLWVVTIRKFKKQPKTQQCLVFKSVTFDGREFWNIHPAQQKAEGEKCVSNKAALSPKMLALTSPATAGQDVQNEAGCPVKTAQLSGHQVGVSMAELPLVPWRLPGKPCPVCKKDHCLPEQLYESIDDLSFDAQDGRIKKHALENLYQGDLQPLSHFRFELTRADGLVRTVYYRLGVWHCVQCSGTRSQTNQCQDIATILTWLGIMLPPKGVPKTSELVRNQAAWDRMADKWEHDYPAEVKRLVESTRRYMPKAWFLAKTDPVDRVVAMLLLTDCDTPLRYAGGKLRKWAQEGILERPFSYGTVQATKSLPGIKQYLDNLRRSHVAAFGELAESLGTDASGMTGGCKALYNKERAATRDAEATRQLLPDADDPAVSEEASKDSKMKVEDKPYNMVQFSFIRETRMIPELGFFQKNLKDIKKDGVHVAVSGKIIIRGEQPWVWPMVFNAKLVNPRITEYHGDKGEFSEKLFLGGEKMGIVIDVPHKVNFKPAGSGGVFATPKGAATRKLMKDLEDPEAFLDRYYQREVDEGCIGGIKREMRAWLRNIKPEHQEIEAMLMAQKWNIKWGLYEKYNRNLVPNYGGHVAIVFDMKLPDLDVLALRYNGDKGWEVMLRDLNALKTDRLDVGQAPKGS